MHALAFVTCSGGQIFFFVFYLAADLKFVLSSFLSHRTILNSNFVLEQAEELQLSSMLKLLLMTAQSHKR